MRFNDFTVLKTSLEGLLATLKANQGRQGILAGQLPEVWKDQAAPNGRFGPYNLRALLNFAEFIAPKLATNTGGVIPPEVLDLIDELRVLAAAWIVAGVIPSFESDNATTPTTPKTPKV